MTIVFKEKNVKDILYNHQVQTSKMQVVCHVSFIISLILSSNNDAVLFTTVFLTYRTGSLCRAWMDARWATTLREQSFIPIPVGTNHDTIKKEATQNLQIQPTTKTKINNPTPINQSHITNYQSKK